MYVFMLAIIGGSDLRQEARNHLDDVCDWHCADLVLLSNLLLAPQRVSRAVTRACQNLFAGEALDMIKVANLDPIWRR